MRDGVIKGLGSSCVAKPMAGIEIGRGSSDSTCAVAAVETWIKFAKLAHGPLFRPTRDKAKPLGQNG